MKLCKDCKYFVPDIVNWSNEIYQMQYAKCALTAKTTGFDGVSCSTRRNSWFDACGRNAKQWEAKDEAK